MPENWKTYKLDDLGTIARGKSKHRPRDAAHLYGGEYPFIQTGDVKGANHKLYCHSQTYSETGLKQSKLWPKDTMCITIAANIAETTILTYPACFPDSIIGFIADEAKCNIDFIEYMMQYFKKEVQSHSIGSVQDNINLATFQRVEFLVPPVAEQRAIASILSALDDKIELNLQMNKTLEEMAMALYKHRFVDFGPFQNGKFVESELGMIPEGWKNVEFRGILSLIKDGSHNPPKRVENGVKFIAGATDIKKLEVTFDKCTYISRVDYDQMHRNWEVREGDVLMTIVGTIGNTAIVQKMDLPFSLQRSIAIFRANPEIPNNFIYLLINSTDFRGYVQAHTNPTGQPGIYLKTLGDFKLSIPKNEILNQFNIIITPWFRQMFSNLNENQTLTTLRDTLLPKLISGQIRVKDAEQMLAASL